MRALCYTLRSESGHHVEAGTPPGKRDHGARWCCAGNKLPPAVADAAFGTHGTHFTRRDLCQIRNNSFDSAIWQALVSVDINVVQQQNLLPSASAEIDMSLCIVRLRQLEDMWKEMAPDRLITLDQTSEPNACSSLDRSTSQPFGGVLSGLVAAPSCLSSSPTLVLAFVR